MKSVAIIFAAIFAVSYAAAPCDDFTIVSCILKIGEGFNSKDPRVPEDNFEMDRRCRAVVPGLECLEDALTRCPPKDMTREYLQFIRDQTRMENQVCDRNNDLRKRLLKHSKCLNGQMSELEEKCGNALIVHSNRFSDEDCEPHYKYRKCYADITKKNCGDGGLETAKMASFPILNFFDTICKKS